MPQQSLLPATCIYQRETHKNKMTFFPAPVPFSLARSTLVVILHLCLTSYMCVNLIPRLFPPANECWAGPGNEATCVYGYSLVPRLCKGRRLEFLFHHLVVRLYLYPCLSRVQLWLVQMDCQKTPSEKLFSH